MKEVAALPAEEQVKAVSKKLVELNPGFDGKVEKKIKNGEVTDLSFVHDNVTDISPVRALVGLTTYFSSATGGVGSKLSDLSPLSGLPLTYLGIVGSDVSDLNPLRRMPLTEIFLPYSQVSTLTPLKDMHLVKVTIRFSQVSDLSPLEGMPVTLLQCDNTQVSDLSPLKELSLNYLRCDFKPERDTAILRSIKTLETINGKPVTEFWEEVDAASKR